MKIFLSDIDRQNSRSVALKNIARLFHIAGWEFKSNDELKQDIENLNNYHANIINQLLNNYFSAYEEWFDFYQDKKAIEVKQDKEYELSDEEQLELKELINQREKTLMKLQNKFDSLQEQKFNQHQFEKDNPGIINED